MDNEIAEGLQLGFNLILSVAIAVMVVTLSSIIRTGYIYRERDILYNNEVQERLIWQELNLTPDYSSGIANKRHITDTDSVLKFITDHSEELLWVVFIMNTENTGYNAYYNCSLSSTERSCISQVLGYGYINWVYVDPLEISANNAMVKEIYTINSERFVINHTVQNKAYVYTYLNRNDILARQQPIKWFESDYVQPDLGVAIFHIY